MLSEQQNIALFQLLFGQLYPREYDAAPPTPASIARINSALGIALPASFIRFAQACPFYGAWFASIGDDWDNPLNIVQLNARFHTAVGAEASPPAWFVLINHGHDFDCDGFNTTKFEAETGEYHIQYVCPDGPDFVAHANHAGFPSYLENFVLALAESHYDNKNRGGRIRTDSRDVVMEIDRILALPDAKQ